MEKWIANQVAAACRAPSLAPHFVFIVLEYLMASGKIVSVDFTEMTPSLIWMGLQLDLGWVGGLFSGRGARLISFNFCW